MAIGDNVSMNIIKTSQLPSNDYGFLKNLSLDQINKITSGLDKGTLIVQQAERTRSKIGMIFVVGFFIFLFFAIIGTLAYNFAIYSLTSSKEFLIDVGTMVPLIGTVIGTPLGFVMGYYFKDDTK